MSGATGLSEEQWQALYSRLARPLFNLAYRYLWTPQEAEDVVHDGFLQVWTKRQHLRPDTADRYLWTCVLNLARKRWRWRRLRCAFDSGDHVIDAVPDGQTIEGTVLRQEEESRLRVALDALPSKLRDVLLLTEFSGLRYEEIAAALGIPPGTVGSRRHLAIARLRSLLREESARE